MILPMNSKNSKKSQRRGQMEAIGLVIIVILITLGMLFLATFALQSDSQKKIFTRKGLSYSAMSAVMKTTVSADAECFAQGFGSGTPKLGADIIENCVKYRGVNDPIYQCKGPITKQPLHSCDFFREMTEYLLDQTLGGWNKNYEFRSQLISLDGSTPIELVEIKVDGGCPPVRDRDSSGLFPINTEAGLVENVLFLCD
ncbi:MAG: hypothetical protein A2822_00020 [Candidatus Staskawiczbacteria bacterium RIFCSPHIGHO2_01_FULL_41_41]|uniref:Uncharacterized protein n=1 Tax=Candidatus Staskawiczbacteria bacterium RIFCSPHIGHO2_01_FULL_41_41 TaxID=1802203 RepID=A0A1G2HT74_9BACT|nr:MAG: hypothetical protein A2822_00020 [Candidatus Staskawiczbacteria bacterium RIFCSPHIGHO2_01_FULL_41_41]